MLTNDEIDTLRHNVGKIIGLPTYLWGSYYYDDATDKSDLDLIVFSNDWMKVKRDLVANSFRVTELPSLNKDKDFEFILDRQILGVGSDKGKIDIFVYPEAARDVVLAMNARAIGFPKSFRKCNDSWNKILLEMLDSES